MPKDRRLWIKLSTDVARNPKLAALSDAAFRAWIECLAHAKEINLDGFLPGRDIRRWMPEFGELLTDVDNRPLVVTVEGGFRIRDYLEHQESADSVERRRRASKENGAKGGRPKNLENLDANPARVPRSKPESRVQKSTTNTYVDESSHVSTARDVTDSFTSPLIADMARLAGVIDPARFQKTISVELGLDVAFDHLAAIVTHLVAKSPKHVGSSQAYATTCIRTSPEEVRKFIHDTGLAS